MLSKEVSSTIFKVFGMTRPGIEPRSPGPMVNTLPTWTMSVVDVVTEMKQLISKSMNSNNYIKENLPTYVRN